MLTSLLVWRSYFIRFYWYYLHLLFSHKLTFPIFITIHIMFLTLSCICFVLSTWTCLWSFLIKFISRFFIKFKLLNKRLLDILFLIFTNFVPTFIFMWNHYWLLHIRLLWFFIALIVSNWLLYIWLLSILFTISNWFIHQLVILVSFSLSKHLSLYHFISFCNRLFS